MDASGTCSQILQKFDAKKMEVQESIDTMDTMLFKPRDDIDKASVKRQLTMTAPMFTEIEAICSEMDALVRSKAKQARRL